MYNNQPSTVSPTTSSSDSTTSPCRSSSLSEAPPQQHVGGARDAKDAEAQKVLGLAHVLWFIVIPRSFPAFGSSDIDALISWGSAIFPLKCLVAKTIMKLVGPLIAVEKCAKHTCPGTAPMVLTIVRNANPGQPVGSLLQGGTPGTAANNTTTTGPSNLKPSNLAEVALYVAVTYDRLEVVVALIERLEIPQEVLGKTLHTAISRYNSEIAQWIVEHLNMSYMEFSQYTGRLSSCSSSLGSWLVQRYHGSITSPFPPWILKFLCTCCSEVRLDLAKMATSYLPSLVECDPSERVKGMVVLSSSQKRNKIEFAEWYTLKYSIWEIATHESIIELYLGACAAADLEYLVWLKSAPKREELTQNDAVAVLWMTLAEGNAQIVNWITETWKITSIPSVIPDIISADDLLPYYITSPQFRLPYNALAGLETICKVGNLDIAKRASNLFDMSPRGVCRSEIDVHLLVFTACCYGHLELAKWLTSEAPFSMISSTRDFLDDVLGEICINHTDTKPEVITWLCQFMENPYLKIEHAVGQCGWQCAFTVAQAASLTPPPGVAIASAQLWRRAVEDWDLFLGRLLFSFVKSSDDLISLIAEDRVYWGMTGVPMGDMVRILLRKRVLTKYHIETALLFATTLQPGSKQEQWLRATLHRLL